MNTTTEKKKADYLRAVAILENHRHQISNKTAQVIISQENGKGLTDYLRVMVAYQEENGQTQLAHLTWAIGLALGYSLRDRNGRWELAISGGNFSKPLDVAIALGKFYGVKEIRFGTI